MGKIVRYFKQLFRIDYPDKLSEFAKSKSDQKIELLKKIVQESDKDQRKALGL